MSNGSSRPFPKDQILWEKAHRQGPSGLRWGRGLWPQTPCPVGSQAASLQLKGAPVCQVCPQVPGLVMFTRLAWAVCQHQDQTKICCSTSQPLPWRLATPQRPACEGRKQEAGLVHQPPGPWLRGWGGGGQEQGEGTQ